VAVFFSLIFFAAGIAHAQNPTATVSGIVSDPSGAAVPAAKVTVIDIARGVHFETHTNPAGVYFVNDLIPSTYKITVDAAGFRTYVLDTFPLNANQQAALNITLEIGKATQTVEVKSQVQLVEPSNATLGGLIENKQVQDLPLVNRNVIMLAALEPGVQPSTPNNFTSTVFTSANRYSINGGAEATSDMQIDGISMLAQADSLGVMNLSMLPSVESVQEFHVQTNDYSSNFGRSGGGIVSMVTKSGTNGFHGSAFEYIRNTAFNAQGFFQNRSHAAISPLHLDQYGGSLGGPVIKNKTFFFVTYERTLSRATGNSFFTVPTPQERAGDFSQDYNANGKVIQLYNPFSTVPNPASPGNYIRTAVPNNNLTQIPGVTLDPIALKAMAYIPLPNLPGTAIAGTSLYRPLNNLYAGGFASSPVQEIDTRGDHNFSTNKRGFLRFDKWHNVIGAPNYWHNVADESSGNLDFKVNNGVIGYTQVFGGATVLDLRLEGNEFRAFRAPPGYGFDITTLGFSQALAAYMDAGSVPQFPGIGITNYSALSSQSGYYYNNNSTSWIGVATLSRVVGRHTLSMGGEARAYFLYFFANNGVAANFGVDFTQGPNPRTVCPATAPCGDAFASFLLGTGDSGGAGNYNHPANGSHFYAQFVQDDIKWTRRLTTNVGFRLEEETGTTERYNRMSTIDPTVLNPISSQVTSPFTGTTPRDVYGAYVFPGNGADSLGRRALRPVELKPSPRFGIAYSLNDKTVIRAGYGIFFGISPAAATREWSSTGFGFNSTTNWVNSLDGITPYTTLNNAWPTGGTYNTPPGSSQGLLTDVGQGLLGGWPQTLRSPYNQQWNFSVQRSLRSDTLLQVAYVGNKGTRLMYFNEGASTGMDQLPPADESQGNSLLALVSNPFAGKISTGGTLNATTVQYGQLERPFPEWQAVTPDGEGIGNSEYEALEVMVQKRLKSGTSFVAGYTWNKLMSDVSDGHWVDASELSGGSYRSWYCHRCEHSESTLDFPSRFTFSSTAELPFGKGKRFGAGMPAVLNYIVGGYQANVLVTLGSGAPLLPTVASNNSYSFGGGEHPNQVPGVDPKMEGSFKTLSEWFNTAAWAQPANFTSGTMARTFTTVRTDWTKNMDLSIFKNFNIKEKVQLQFRGEAFNLTNTPVFGAPGASLGSSSFGIVSSQANSPRTIQLALKLLF
jgi:hypothetical protein